MRVLLVSGSFPPMTDGVGDYAEGLATALASTPGVEVGVLTNAEAATRAPASFELTAAMRSWRLEEFREVRRAVAAFRPDVVHVQYPTVGYRYRELPWLLPGLLGLFGLRVLRTWHEYYATMFNRGRFIAAALPPGEIIVVRPDWGEQRPAWTRALVPDSRLTYIPSAPPLPAVHLGEAERQAIKRRFVSGDKALLVFFGFLFEHKGIEEALALVDPETQHLLLLGDVKPELDPYGPALLERLKSPELAARATALGFTPPEEAARILCAADAALLPFRQGGGDWNSSFLAAVLQGTFVLTTSTTHRGYDRKRNVYYARPRDLHEMREALRAHLGARRDPDQSGDLPSWSAVAEQHLAMYRRNL